MSELKTLQEVCNELNVSRRAIQGYEKVGLVVATDRNKYGYLLYDKKERQRIERIKLYQRLGFTIKEIGEFIDAPNFIVKKILERQVEKLKEEQKKIDTLIIEAKALIEELSE